ncbi:MAG: hypothetical protein HQK49_10910 [Oligoflexia bacterium]|nr:hypothetical protein [Oligoflexia bacterium]
MNKINIIKNSNLFRIFISVFAFIFVLSFFTITIISTSQAANRYSYKAEVVSLGPIKLQYDQSAGSAVMYFGENNPVLSFWAAKIANGEIIFQEKTGMLRPFFFIPYMMTGKGEIVFKDGNTGIFADASYFPGTESILDFNLSLHSEIMFFFNGNIKRCQIYFKGNHVANMTTYAPAGEYDNSRWIQENPVSGFKGSEMFFLPVEDIIYFGFPYYVWAHLKITKYPI